MPSNSAPLFRTPEKIAIAAIVATGLVIMLASSAMAAGPQASLTLRALNPQPEPPVPAETVISRTGWVLLNPQPVPPRESLLVIRK